VVGGQGRGNVVGGAVAFGEGQGIEDGFMSDEGGSLSGGFVRQVDRMFGHLLSMVGAEGVSAEGGVGMAVFEWHRGGLIRALTVSVAFLPLR
jgi:hypothetical protein